jgi:hypothetical protein
MPLIVFATLQYAPELLQHLLQAMPQPVVEIVMFLYKYYAWVWNLPLNPLTIYFAVRYATNSGTMFRRLMNRVGAEPRTTL